MKKPDKISPLALVGIPFDEKSSFMQGPALAPPRIREVLHNGSANYWTELNMNPIENERFHDLGDLKVKDYFEIENQVAEILATGKRTICLGGDHSIAYPIIKAQSRFFDDFEILQIDAHGDLYDEFEGDRFSHACPFARIMEDDLASRLTQVGIRTLNPHQRKQADKYKVRIIEMKDIQELDNLTFEKPLYISVDLDGFDPAFAPGVSHHEPGGLFPRQVIDLIHKIQVPIIGADIVELNPHRDLVGITASLAAKLLKEIAGKMLFQFFFPKKLY